MSVVLQKLNFKGQAQIIVLHAPDSFAPTLDEMRPMTEVTTSMGRARGVCRTGWEVKQGRRCDLSGVSRRHVEAVQV